VSLAAELGDAAKAAAAFAGTGERVEAVLAVEPAGAGRVYVCAFAGGEERTWLVLGADGAPVTQRERVREAVSLAALCEIAGEAAGDEAPRVASPAYLDSVGSQEAVGPALEAVEALTQEVEAAYKQGLT
jgi:hypothetical protein